MPDEAALPPSERAPRNPAWSRRGPVRSGVVLAAGIVFALAPAGPGASEEAAGPPPIGPPATERPLGMKPLPPARPDLLDTLEPACAPEEPELLWTSLPREMRAADLGTMIGQLLVTSFLGNDPDDPGVARAVEAIADGRIGGVLFFRHNVGTRADVEAVTAAMRAASPALPPFLAVDQEGGAVARLGPAEGVPALPAARRLAAMPLAEARALFAETARALADLGFNLNLAPVVDLDLEPRNPVIGRFGRAFSADADAVVAYATAFVEAHRAAGVLTALKHFPGHGSSLDDSHDGTADVTATWGRRELEPFRRLIAAGKADLVMAGHLMLETVDPGGDGPAPPATMSRVLLGDVLRNRLCFDGLIVSDDLNMRAIAETWPLEEAIVAALGAGNDVVIASIGGDGHVSEVDSIIAAVRRAAREDHALRAAIRHAYARVVHFKLDRAAGLDAPRSARPRMSLAPVLAPLPGAE